MGAFPVILRCLRSDDFGWRETCGVCVIGGCIPMEALLGPSTVLIGGDDGFGGEKRDAIMSYRIRNQEILLLDGYGPSARVGVT